MKIMISFLSEIFIIGDIDLCHLCLDSSLFEDVSAFYYFTGYLLLYLTCFASFFRQLCVLTRLEFEICNVLISSLRLIMVRNARYCVLCNIFLLWLLRLLTMEFVWDRPHSNLETCVLFSCFTSKLFYIFLCK